MRVVATGLRQLSSHRGLGGSWHLAHHCASLPGLLVVVSEPGTGLFHSCREQVRGWQMKARRWQMARAALTSMGGGEGGGPSIKE